MKNVKFDENVAIKKKKMKKVKSLDYQSSVSDNKFTTDKKAESKLNTSVKSSKLLRDDVNFCEEIHDRSGKSIGVKAEIQEPDTSNV